MSWDQVLLGELCTIQSGSSNTQDADPDGPYIFFDRSKKPKRSNKFLFDCEALIIAGEGAEFRPKRVNGKFDLHQRAYAIFGFGQRLLGDYLFYYLEHVHRYFQEVAVGATVKSLRQRHFDNLPVSLPPLEEQKRIVAVLDQAFAAFDRARALAEANLADAEEFFEAGLDKIISEQDSGAARTTLGAICSFENGDRGKNYPGRKAFVPQGVPFINAGHLEDGRIDWAGMNFIPEERFHRLGNGKVKPDDILFCLRGSLGKFGKVDREGLGAIASSLVIVRAKQGVLTDFLSIYFRSKTCKQMIEEYAGGAAQPNLSAGDLKKFKILLPDRDAQRRAIQASDAFADRRDRLYSSYSAKILDVTELRRSLLQKAFAGELT